MEILPDAAGLLGADIEDGCNAASACFRSVTSKATPWMNQGAPFSRRTILASQWNHTT
jgi:hypothetical protein